MQARCTPRRTDDDRARVRENTVKSWEEYRATGLHATAEEVDEWLASWGTDSERPAPEPHE